MDIYSIFKFLHVLTATAWVGGGLTLLAATIFVSRGKGEAGLFATLDIMNSLGKVWFVPTSFLTVIFGAVATTLGGLWSEVWVILGLCGFASTFFTGLLLIEPRGRQIGAMLEQGDTLRAAVQGQKLMGIVKFDYTVMLVIIADMVLKPGWGDVGLLATYGLVIAVGALAFLVPALKPVAVAA